jgi:FKBP-type peptidyl-prolyl cis-trans isomerase SlyD
MIIEKNKVVALEYTLKDDKGHILDQNEGFAPLEYLHGAGNVVRGLEAALQGMKCAERKEIELQPEDAFGASDPNLVFEIPKSQVEAAQTLSVGDVIELPNGQEAEIVAHQANTFTVDANHPLAGETLLYAVHVVSIRDATDDEMQHGAPLSLTLINQACCPPGCC